ncbi:MAG: hypothetical protein A3K09_02435 [Nitrospinae bacterium RIFCSPLOWO2_12_FULL_47_7]|nr:MAG: hypothetical protein A3K09_02435 [Nitrospinae bacterium RIFCSPLOWO2_12_FULL_47_7]
MIDELYDATIVNPAIEGSFFLWRICDAKGVDGAVNGVAQVVGWLSNQARAYQSGFVRNYALFMVIGFISFLIIVF